MEDSRNILSDYVNIEALALELKCSTRTIARRVNEPNGLPFVRLGGRIYFSVLSVKRWIAEKETQRNPKTRRIGGR